MDVTGGFADKLPPIVNQFKADLKVDEDAAIAAFTLNVQKAHDTVMEAEAGLDVILEKRLNQAFDRLTVFRNDLLSEIDARLAVGVILKAAPKT